VGENRENVRLILTLLEDWIDEYHQDFDAETFVDFFSEGNTESGSPTRL
jgi:hypothetical protein